MVRTSTILVGIGLVSFVQSDGKCQGQSCDIANISQSTNTPFDYSKKKRPNGGNRAGDMCIEKAWDKLGLPHPPGYGKGPPNYAKGGQRRRLKERDALMARNLMVNMPRNTNVQFDVEQKQSNDQEKKQFGGCQPYTLLFSRGTFEPYTGTNGYGMTVGPALKSALGSSGWSFQGVNYDADMAGDFCLGMTGGMKCMEHLNKLSNECPQTKIVVSGYSQGAMVSHICVAFASEAAKKQVSSVVLFGDPFNGAQIKGYPNERIKTFCAMGDGVCSGEFNIGAAHMAYTAGSDIRSAVNFINAHLKS